MLKTLPDLKSLRQTFLCGDPFHENGFGLTCSDQNNEILSNRVPICIHTYMINAQTKIINKYTFQKNNSLVYWTLDRVWLFNPCEIITIDHECPCRIAISHPRGRNFNQGRGLPSLSSLVKIPTPQVRYH